MRILILLVLAVIGVGAGVVQYSAKANLNVGTIGDGDRLMHRSGIYHGPFTNPGLSEDPTFQGDATRTSAAESKEASSSAAITLPSTSNSPKADDTANRWHHYSPSGDD